MRRGPPTGRLLLALVAASAGLQTGFDCNTPAPLAVTSPAAGAVLSTFQFDVEVRVDPAALRPGTLQATLNGSPLALSGGPSVYTASVGPGGALEDSNVLHVGASLQNGVGVSTDRAFQYLPPKARAHRITSPSELVRGPLAHGRVGDWMLENAEARFVVQDVAQRDLYSIGQFGGNVIDAELVGRPDRDAFFEIQPSVNVETVINAQTATIVNDGQDGLPAVLRVCGPDDLLDFVNASSVAAMINVTFPPAADDKDYDVEACTEYVLEPGKRALRLDTTITNLTNQAQRFYAGDYVNGMGELELWTSSGYGIGELPFSSLGVMSWIGTGESEGVDYAFLTVAFPGAPLPQSGAELDPGSGPAAPSLEPPRAARPQP
jgi:hypothetical protein